MAGKTNYLEQALLNAVLRNTAYTSPTSVTVGLFTAAPNDAYTTGVPTGTEVTGGSYARAAVTFGAPSGTPRVSSNSGTVTFPAPSANWGLITHYGIFDNSNNLLYWNTLAASKNVNNGDAAPTFAAGQLTITED